jgi:hypothetical protein
VGSDDVELQAETHLDALGNLVIEQRIINRSTSPVSFDCQLHVPGRRAQRTTLRSLAPGVNRSVFVVPQGEPLLGKTLWIRAEELLGRRVLNRQLTAAK